MKRYIILFLAFLIPFALQAGTKITGKVKTADGKIPKLAHAHLATIDGNYRNALQMVEADKKGKFEFEVSEPGVYTVFLSAVDHQTIGIPIKIEENDKPIHVEVMLLAIEYVDSFDEVKIVGDWNEFNLGAPDVMEKQSDSTFIFEAEATTETLAYQLFGIDKNNHSINGLVADYFIWDGGGDYKSVLKVKPGKVKIVFDPNKISAYSNEGLPKVMFDKDHNYFEKLVAATVKASRIQNELFTAFSAHRKAEKDPKDFKYDGSELISILKELSKNENEFVRQIATIRLFEASTWPGIDESKDVAEIVQVVPPSSDIWGYRPFLAGAVSRFSLPEEKKDAILNDFIKNNPNKEVRAQVLSSMVFFAKQQNQTEKFEALYKELAGNYGDLPSVQFIIKMFDPKRKIMVGKKVPAFAVTLMGSSETVSNETLLGKFYLMDFWAVWCGPCIAEMPNLHEIYEKFKRPNLIFLSLSFDGKPKDVEKYRAEKFKMPWLHTFVEGGFRSELAQNFEVLGIPKPLFVGPDGTILATEMDLRGPNLEKTLEKFLEKSGTND